MSGSPVVVDALGGVGEALVRLPLLTRRALTVAFAELRDKGSETAGVWQALAVLAAAVTDDERFTFERLADDAFGADGAAE